MKDACFVKKEDNPYRGPVRTPVDFSKHLTMAPPPEGVACGHPGCLHHISHPCEGCVVSVVGVNLRENR